MGNDVTDRIHYGVDGYLRARDPLIDKCYGYTVYGHLTPSHKWYFGITRMRPERRWGRNGMRYKSCPHFFNAVRKYGWNNIYHIIIGTGYTKDEACCLEQQLITKYNATDKRYGYNISYGGDVGNDVNLPTNSRPVWCIETGQFFFSSADAGRFLGISGGNIGMVCRHKGATAGGFHWSFTDEPYVEPACKNRRGIIICCENNKIYQSASDAARDIGVSQTVITKALNGRSDTAGGYHWKRLYEYRDYKAKASRKKAMRKPRKYKQTKGQQALF